MDFLKNNLINTTTAVVVDSNTLSVQNLFNRNLNYQYYSDGYNNDLTTTSITINFDTTTAVSRIVLNDINWKSFDIFYNGATANSITLVDQHTNTASFTSNSDTSMYLRFATLAVSSITIDIHSTIEADKEKVIGFLYMSDAYFTFTRIPSAQKYKPSISPKQIVHKMGDGGTRIHNISKKIELDMSFKYINDTERDNLDTIYNLDSEFWFCPFGTSTSWDKVCFEAVWVGDFDFKSYSDNALSSGYSGKVSLRETPI